MTEYSGLPTEQPHPDRPELDAMAPEAIARLLLREEQRALHAVDAALPEIATVCAWAADALRAGGRLIYAGAGTSGRLGVLDASEMGPTFGAEPGRVVGLLAGAPQAMTEAIEGAEDDYDAGALAVKELEPTERDVVIGISMSGTAAFVQGALDTAVGHRALVTANPDADCEFKIVLGFGAEALAGSTRLKGADVNIVDLVARAALRCDAPRLVLTGYADSLGPESRNMALARYRAEAVAA